jgi:hypothetical protein
MLSILTVLYVSRYVCELVRTWTGTGHQKQNIDSTLSHSQSLSVIIIIIITTIIMPGDAGGQEMLKAFAVIAGVRGMEWSSGADSQHTQSSRSQTLGRDTLWVPSS